MLHKIQPVCGPRPIVRNPQQGQPFERKGEVRV
jgi:hypothetical protein